MSKWIGYAVSVNCGEPLGCYQGTILEADGTTITLTKAFRNGFPYPKSQVTLNAADIKDLKIIEPKTDAKQTHSTVAVTKSNKKSQKATVCENLQANQTNAGDQVVTSVQNNGRSAAAPTARSKPIDIQGPRPGKNGGHGGSYGNAGSTPKGRGGGQERARRRNEACFGEAAAGAYDDDFDFEGNLALFDRAALREEMRGARPDLLRHFRHDENVLGDAPPRPPGPAADYVTDAGAGVPSAEPRLRRRLWAGVRRLGLGEFAGALLARAAADVALRLAGAPRRLEPRNAHQPPCVVALAGAHESGAAALAAVRLLAAQGARAWALRPAAGGPCAALARELAAAEAGDVRLVDAAGQLPRADVVVAALQDAAADAPPAAAALAWLREARAAVLALEPPQGGWEGVTPRASVFALLPPLYTQALGRVFLADVGAPARVFVEQAVAERPRFGLSALLPLHPADAQDAV